MYTTPDGERRKETEWFDVTTWRRQAESCNQFLTKGQRVFVEGRLRTRSWEDQDGKPRFRMEIQADRVIFLDRKPAAPSELGPGEEIEAEELPF
jgi:single-strand DNA-binding protein